MALRTRSRLSRTLASGRPTIVNAGKAERDVDLDLDDGSVDAEDGGGAHAGEHAVGACKRRVPAAIRAPNPRPTIVGWLRICAIARRWPGSQNLPTASARSSAGFPA